MTDIVVLLVTLTTPLFAEVELAAVSDILAGTEVLDDVARSEVVVDATESEATEVEDEVAVDSS